MPRARSIPAADISRHSGRKPENRPSVKLTVSLQIQTIHLTALLDDGVPAAGKAELVSDVAGTLNKVSVLKFAPAVCTLQLRSAAHLITAVT